MNISVGFAFLVTVAVLEGVTGTTSQCEVAGGECQSTMDPCDGGELLTDDFYCGVGNTPNCCIPPGCVYGSKALRNGAITKRGCTQLKCQKGIMIKDDTECQTQQDFDAQCPIAGGLLLNQRCFFSNFGEKTSSVPGSWDEARKKCVTFKTITTKPHLPMKLASFAGITDVIPTDLQGISYWTGGSDTAVKGTWKWLDGRVIKATTFDDECLLVKYSSGRISYDTTPCTAKNNYICELPKEPSTACTCNTNTHGCTLAEPNMPGLACQCKLRRTTKGVFECEGTLVTCEDSASLDCIHPGIGIEHCRQGQGADGRQGNCCGYAAAKC